MLEFLNAQNAKTESRTMRFKVVYCSVMSKYSLFDKTIGRIRARTIILTIFRSATNRYF